jgi:predicted transcriptional regulator
METEITARDVRSRRRAAGLSHLELAQRAGCGESTIRMFDRGYTPARSEALPRVLSVLEGAETDPSREVA